MIGGIREFQPEFCRDAASVAVAIEREMVDHVPDAMRIAGLVSNNEEAKAVESEVIKLVGWYMTAARLANRNSEECARIVYGIAKQRDDALRSKGSGQNLADAHSKNPPEAEHG